jgi:hypothetical protein
MKDPDEMVLVPLKGARWLSPLLIKITTSIYSSEQPDGPVRRRKKSFQMQ